MGAAEWPEVAAVRQLASHLGDRPSLLVLDNCEHVIDGCGELVGELLAANPTTRVLATSREPLGVSGEITFRVPSLPCPRPERSLDVEAVSQYDAVRLFLERARRARPSFVVSEANCPAVAQICHRLDGIPLAIELAASRCRQMSAEHIATELDDRFRLLTGGARTAIARQQTLAASVDWSHDRLDDAERGPSAGSACSRVSSRSKRPRPSSRRRLSRAGQVFDSSVDLSTRASSPSREPLRQAALSAVGDLACLRPRPGPRRRRTLAHCATGTQLVGGLACSSRARLTRTSRGVPGIP